MANAVRQICTKIGNGQQYLNLLSTAKTSAYGCHVMSDTIQQRLVGRPVIYHGLTLTIGHSSQHPKVLTRIYRKCVYFCFQVKPNCINTFFRQSQHLCYIEEPFKNKQSLASTVVWFKRDDRNANTKPDDSFKFTSSNNYNTLLDSKGLPSAEQLNYVYNKLGENVSIQ